MSAHCRGPPRYFIRRSVLCAGGRPLRPGAERDHHRPPSAVRQGDPAAHANRRTHSEQATTRDWGDDQAEYAKSYTSWGRLCVSRVLKTLRTGRRFLEGCERLRALRRGSAPLGQDCDLNSASEFGALRRSLREPTLSRSALLVWQAGPPATRCECLVSGLCGPSRKVT